MKQIIPLKKDIIFKTRIGEITNINLEKNYKIKDDIIDGYINVYGTYKMTEASVLEEEFNYKIPFGVSITKKVKKDTIKIEIDDFNYKFNKDVLSVNINLDLECDDDIEKEESKEEIINIENKEGKDEKVIEEKEGTLEKEEVEENINEDEDKNVEIEDNIKNITNIVNNNENYYIYKVYIVREGDTIESISNKYNVDLNDLKEYNDTNNIKIGDKIIIPYINE